MIEIKISPDKDFKTDEERAALRSNLLSQIEAAEGYLDRVRDELCTKRLPKYLKETSTYSVSDYKSKGD